MEKVIKARVINSIGYYKDTHVINIEGDKGTRASFDFNDSPELQKKLKINLASNGEATHLYGRKIKQGRYNGIVEGINDRRRQRNDHKNSNKK